MVAEGAVPELVKMLACPFALLQKAAACTLSMMSDEKHRYCSSQSRVRPMHFITGHQYHSIYCHLALFDPIQPNDI